MDAHQPYYPVVIIGAGPAGLRAAFDLVDLGVHPLVIERRERAGGRLLELERWFSLDACGLCRLLDGETRPIVPSADGDILCLRRDVARQGLTLMTSSTVETARAEDGRLVISVASEGRPLREISCRCAIVAAGLEDTNLDYLSQLGAGREADVVTAVRFEEMIARSAARPLTRPSDNRPVRSVGFVACAGSRDDRSPWCSSSCCGFLVKEISLLREVDATIETHLFCMDLRLHGKGMTLYGERALEKTRIHRARGGSVERRAGGTLELRAVTDDAPVEVEVDLVVLSGGQRPSSGRLLERLEVGTDESGFPVPAAPEHPWSTSNPLVFAAGSCHNPCDIATSVMEGRSAAAAAFERLAGSGGGDGSSPGRVLVVGGGLAGLEASRVLARSGQAVTLVEKEDRLGGLAATVRLDPGSRDLAAVLAGLEQELNSSDRVERILSKETARLDGRPGSFSVIADGERLGPFDSVVVATGSGAHRDERLDGDRLLSLHELEARLVRNESPRGDVVFIQCVGSRDERHPYCNRVCCAKAIRLAKEIARSGRGRAWILYRDIVTPGRDEELYESARDAGVLFVRFDAKSPPILNRGTGRPFVDFREKTVGKRIVLNPEIVVLSSGIEPPRPMLEAMHVPVGEDGFAAEDDARFRPCMSTRPGVFVAGNARHPSTTVEAQTSGRCAGAGAAILARILRKEAADVPPSRTRERLCTGCGLCVTVCPAGARLLGGQDGTVAMVQEPLCQACGLCAAACPSGAAVTAVP